MDFKSLPNFLVVLFSEIQHVHSQQYKKKVSYSAYTNRVAHKTLSLIYVEHILGNSILENWNNSLAAKSRKEGYLRNEGLISFPVSFSIAICGTVYFQGGSQTEF